MFVVVVVVVTAVVLCLHVLLSHVVVVTLGGLCRCCLWWCRCWCCCVWWRWRWWCHCVSWRCDCRRRCRCRRLLDPLGDHRATCPHAGVLGRKGAPLERACARVCREAGARVATNMLFRELNLDGVASNDERQLEVIANGLPLFCQGTGQCPRRYWINHNGSTISLNATMSVGTGMGCW